MAAQYLSPQEIIDALRALREKAGYPSNLSLSADVENELLEALKENAQYTRKVNSDDE